MFLAALPGPGSHCPLGPPSLFRHRQPKPEMQPPSPWRSLFGLTGALLGAVPFPARTALSKPCTVLMRHGVPLRSPSQLSRQEPGCCPVSDGVVGLSGTPDDALHPGVLHRCGEPHGSSSTGPGPRAVPSRTQMGTREGSGCSTDRSWGHGAASPGHSEEKGGCEATSCSPELMSWGWLSGGRQLGNLE